MSISAQYNSTYDWQLRITDRDGGVLRGAAVLVSRLHALTCAHVVVRASGEEGPGAGVRVELPPGATRWSTEATVVEGGWWWKDAPPWDVAVLRLATPAPVGIAAPGHLLPHGRRVRIMGFPQAPAGHWISGTIQGHGGEHTEYVQIQTDPGSPVGVVPGFSGSGVRDEDSGALLGIVRKAAHRGRTVWMVPLTEIPTVWPSTPTRPPGSEESEKALLHELGTAVADLDTVAMRESRDLFVRQLDPRLRRRVNVAASALVFSCDLVFRAHRDFAVLGEVLDLLETWEEASVPVQRVRETASPLLECVEE